MQTKLKSLPCFKHENSFGKIIFNKDESVSDVQNKNKLTKLDIWIKLCKFQTEEYKTVLSMGDQE